MTAPLRPQSAEQFIRDHYYWDKSGRGYIDRKTELLTFFPEVCEAYARAAAPPHESHPSNQLYLAADAANKFLNTVGLDPSERRKQRNEVIRLLTDALHNCDHSAPEALAHSSYLGSSIRLSVGESPAAAPQTRSIDGKFGFKDGKIVNLVSGQEIPEDEPLFLLRARDHHAISVLGTYYYHASKDCNDLHLAGIRQVIEKFEKFKTEHPERMKQPGITRHLKLDESRAAAPAAPLPQRAEDMTGLIGAVWAAHDEWKRLDARGQLSGECDYAEWLADAVLNHLRSAESAPLRPESK